MAIYHCSVKTFSRSKGDSAVSASAYRNGLSIKDERTGLTADYTKRKGVVCSEIIVPENAPAWASKTETLWNEVEKKEGRKNSTVAREFEISLPHELDKTQRLELARNLSKSLVDRFGFAVEFSIHKPDKKEDLNHHVHILASTRKLEANGFTDKTRELDEMMSKDGNPAILEVREMVANTINQHLEKANISARVDHRRLLDQQQEAIQKKDYDKALELSREPTRHVGKNPYYIEQNRQYNNKVKQDFSKLLENTDNQIMVKLVEQKKLETKTRVQSVQAQKPQVPTIKQSASIQKSKNQFSERKLNRRIAEFQHQFLSRSSANRKGENPFMDILNKAGDYFEEALTSFKKAGEWVIHNDHFGIEKRQKEQQQLKWQKERKAIRELEKAQQKEKEWKEKAQAFNQKNEFRIKLETENNYKRTIKPNLEEPSPSFDHEKHGTGFTLKPPSPSPFKRKLGM